MTRFLRLLLLGLALPTGAAAQGIDTLALRGHTYFLSHDLLEGRGTGTRGERLAAHYIVSQLMRLGLQPVGPNGSYELPVPLRAARIDNDSTRLTVGTGANAVAFRSGRDFVVNTGGAAALHDFAGEALFVGTAAQARRALAATGSLQGKVIVTLGSLGGEARTLVPDWIARGAAGVVHLVPDPTSFALYARSRGDTRYFVNAAVDDPVWQPALPMAIAGPDVGRALLAGAQLPDSVLDGKAPARALPLGHRLDVHVRATTSDVPSSNVAGLIPGRDPARRDEVVVYTAHYDHLGISTPDPRGDSIYNGFSDNAAGSAMLLAIADALRREPPARSVLFLFFTGEERGLLGSTYYATAPAVPLARTVAVVNLDAGAPPAPPTEWRFAGGESSSLGAAAQKLAASHGWTATLGGASPNSDYWPFLQRGVPSIFIIPGAAWEGVSGAQQEALRRRWDHYHEAGDEWAADFPFAGLERYAQIALELGRTVADAPARPALLRSAP
ncbi:MAG TPA: M28 family peptidase [Longimicrobiales bacterium]|nr:M28 family peptidase [Longimicrobiales bacterium]